MQNKAIKLISGGSSQDPATPYYSNFKILKLEDLFKIEVGKLVHFHFQRKLPLNLFNPSAVYPTETQEAQKILIYCMSHITKHQDYKDA